ncbi:hypothetical protein BDV96DRAFT_653904 [Lophiotrema nucula]|uniref:Uncharacterized protein n=1 Tax=Lophiotrema nucula TaxID=690887 RepID=A0A6A5YKS3_9PLEO|nr:hypothetical protein BDV96DRAFT_653904 [Lophiotrema nucula]
MAAPYTPPVDNPDGAYLVRFDEKGQPISTRFEMHPNVREATSAAMLLDNPLIEENVAKRDFPSNPRGSCTGRTIPGPQDNSYSVVQNCLGTWLNQNSGGDIGDPYNRGGVFYCRQGDTLLAVCLYDQQYIAGSPAEIQTFNGIMDQDCGSWRSGYVFIKDWNKTYWRTTWGEEICGNDGGVRKQVYA